MRKHCGIMPQSKKKSETKLHDIAPFVIKIKSSKSASRFSNNLNRMDKAWISCKRIILMSKNEYCL